MSEHDSVWISNGPCPDCGSSDACGLYSDGHTYCQAYEAHTNGDGTGVKEDEIITDDGELVTDLSYRDLPKAGLSQRTCRLIGYGVAKTYVDGDTRPCQITNFRKRGKIVGQHLRFMNDKGKKDFRWRGDSSKLELFCEHLWANRPKKIITITEGEKDCGSYIEATEGKFPCVSIPNGASNAAKDIKHRLEFLNQYDKVVLMFDNDEAGQAAVEECLPLFPAGKVAIAQLPDEFKDANEMLLAGEKYNLKWIAHNAKLWEPDEVIGGDDLLQEILHAPPKQSVPYPYPKLQDLTKGLRTGELVTICAGTGVGKSEIVRQIAFSLRMQHDERIGYVALEESATTSALDFMGLELGERLRLTRETKSDEEITELYDKVIGRNGSEMIRFYKHFGSLESTKLVNRIRFMAQGYDCTTIVLDHISIAVSGQESNNERKDIDVLMTNLRSMVEELGIRCVIVSHLKRIDKGTHEEGARVKLSHLRGSGSIAQLSDLVLGAERNQQSEKNNNLTQLRVLKNRWTGQVGAADVLEYDHATGRLSATNKEAEVFKEDKQDGDWDY